MRHGKPRVVCICLCVHASLSLLALQFQVFMLAAAAAAASTFLCASIGFVSDDVDPSWLACSLPYRHLCSITRGGLGVRGYLPL